MPHALLTKNDGAAVVAVGAGSIQSSARSFVIALSSASLFNFPSRHGVAGGGVLLSSVSYK